MKRDDDDKGAIRASLFISAESAKLMKHGRIQNKDLAIEVCAQDWATKYSEMLAQYENERKEAYQLRDHLISKQQSYIYREQEYRTTIELLKKEIDQNSKKPFALPKETQDDELQLEGLKLELNKHEPKPKIQEGVYQNQKEVKEIHQKLSQIHQSIETMQNDAKKLLSKKRKTLYMTLDDHLRQYKEGLEKANEKRQGGEMNQSEQDKSNKETLETMSSMAQKIDEDNQNLMKKNKELKIQFLTQEDDRELLLKQIVYFKKQGLALQTKHDELKSKAEESQRTEAYNDAMLATNLRKPKENAQPNKSRPLTAQVGVKFRPHSGLPTTFNYGKKMPPPSAAPVMQRAQSAINGLQNLQQQSHYEQMTQNYKSLLATEKRKLRAVKTQISNEFEKKTQLEKYLRQSVEDVKLEIAKKRADQIKGKAKTSQEEQDRIIEVLLSQERVLTLLYDRTFPPRQHTNYKLQGLGVQPSAANLEADEHDVAQLEKEIQEVIRCGTAKAQEPPLPKTRKVQRPTGKRTRIIQSAY